MSPVPAGGLRARLIHDSAYHAIRDGLEALGWFNVGNLTVPLTVVGEPFALDVEVPVNTVAVSSGHSTDADAEMGSNLSEDTHDLWVDIYGESEPMGKHLAYDIRDLVRGKLPSAGRGDGPVLPIMDYTRNPPTLVCTATVERVTLDRAENFPHPWQRYWWMLSFQLLDYYGSEAD